MIGAMNCQSFGDVSSFLKSHFAVPTTMKESYSLDRMYALMDLLDNPQNKLKVIHVAGTSGKTSTCYYVAALLAASGKTVGLTVSPHIDEINERIQVNLQPLPEGEFVELFNQFVATPGILELKPSYFELMVAMAFWAFEGRGVDYAVVEVGIGGLGDGTNVINRTDKICVITDIGLDHVAVLGDTIEKIAAQKAGIIQFENQAFSYKQAASVMAVFEERVSQMSAHLTVIGDPPLDPASLQPLFQQRNWYLASQVVAAIAQRDGLNPLTAEQLEASRLTYIPARMETLEYGGKTVILDGAHNPQKLEALVLSVQGRYPDKTIVLLTAFLEARRSNVSESLAILNRLSDQLFATEYTTEQDLRRVALPAEDVVSIAKQVGFKKVSAISSTKDAVAAVLQTDADVLLVTGSLYLLGHVRPFISGISPGTR